MQDVRFFKFPLSSAACLRWTRLCGRGGKDKQHGITDNFVVTKKTRICSRHFEKFGADGQPIGDPTLFARNNYGVSKQPRSTAAINKLASRHNAVTPSPVVAGTCSLLCLWDSQLPIARDIMIGEHKDIGLVGGKCLFLIILVD